MENFTTTATFTMESMSSTFVENFTNTVLENITSTIISILTSEVELSIPETTTTEKLAHAVTSSLTSTTESPVTTGQVFYSSFITTTTTSMEEVETTSATIGNDPLKKSGKLSHGYGTHLPGKLEAAIIICFVGVVLFLAAKYIGCKPSYFCISFEFFKTGRSRSDHGSTGGFIRHENIMQRPEYNRTLQYAVYSRPATANLSQISNADARGYGYSGYDDEEAQAKVFIHGADHIIDPPPEYDSIVPPAYNAAQNTDAYTNTTPAYYTYETSRNIGDVRL